MGGVYAMGATCAVQCFLCHISNFLPSWYCVYGMSICVMMYALTKTFLYSFLLERIKCVQTDRSIEILPEMVTKYILPIYIGGYFIIYAILCPLTFRGEVISSSLADKAPTACLFGEYQAWVFIFSAGVDVFNSIFFLWVFSNPLYKLWKLSEKNRKNENFKESVTDKALRKAIFRLMTYNIVCSTICSISSVTFLTVMAFASSGEIGYYLWFGGNLDIMVNSLCVFSMVGCNRGYISYLIHKYLPKEPPQDDILSIISVKKRTQNDSKLVALSAGSNPNIIKNRAKIENKLNNNNNIGGNESGSGHNNNNNGSSTKEDIKSDIEPTHEKQITLSSMPTPTGTLQQNPSNDDMNKNEQEFDSELTTTSDLERGEVKNMRWTTCKT